MGTVLTLASIIGCLSVGIIIGRRIARRDSEPLYLKMGFSCFFFVALALLVFQDNLTLVACVVSLAVSVFVATWVQSGHDKRQKERDDIAARRMASNGPSGNQPHIGNGTAYGQSTKPVNRFEAALTGSQKPRRKVDYIKLVAMNYNIPYGRKGKANLRSVK